MDVFRRTISQSSLEVYEETEYSAQVEHSDRFELNSLTAKTEQSSRRD